MSLNKRIISLLIEPTDLANAPRELQQLQFVDLTVGEEEYQQNLDKLIKELRENKVYYQQHKVLLVKALKWQEQNRNRSILLRGYNLEHYQSWLEVARRKNLHPPTDLQEEFIAESAKEPPDLALDVFISYSRADGDLARRLNDALQSQGKRTWFDQESIATGTDFQQEIHRGIEQSDNFLFILSPESVNSPYCAGEVEHAKGLNKRFVTVLHRGVNTGELHPELAKVQWLDFNRHGGDFLGNFSELVRALDRDREYVREHTKKSQMALEWTKGDKSVDLLLRGNECNRAYEWLQEVERQRKQPELTEWLKEYIVASKDELERLQQIEEERQQRELRRELDKQNEKRDKLVLSGFLVLMTGLSIFAGWQTVKAQKQTEIARAYQLAAQSENVVGSRFYQRGTLLALESMNKSQRLKEPKLLVATDRALRSGLTLLPDLVSGINHDSSVIAVAFSPDGKYLATASEDKTAGVWSAATGAQIATINHDDRVFAVAFSPDGKYLATASEDKTAGVWDAATGAPIATINHDSSVRALAFSPDGKYLATASVDKTAGVWEAATGTINHDNTVNAVAFSPDGKYLATASSDNTAGVHFLKPEDLINEACGRLSRNLTADEWDRYMNLPLHQYQKTCKGLSAHRSLLAEARKLAEDDKLKEAQKLLGALLKLDDKIDLLPSTEAIDRELRAVVRQFQAEGKVSEGAGLAKDGKVEEATRLFQEAQKLQPDIDLNPDTEEIENDPEAVARQLGKEN